MDRSVEPAERLRIGIVGAGAMGRPLVDRLRGAGHDVAVHVRRPEAGTQLSSAGIEVVDSMKELGAGRDIVILYVFSDEQVRTVALDEGLVDAMEPGSVLVIHTTGSPATARAIAAHAGPRDVGVVDAPGSGGPGQVAEGTLNLFVGGEAEHVERCRPLFDAYAGQITHFGAVGPGQNVKLINNLLFGAHVELALEAARLSAAVGIDPSQLARTLRTCSGASAALDMLASRPAESFVEAVGPFVYKDVVVAREVADGIGASLGTFDVVTAPLLERIRRGRPRVDPPRDG